MRNSFSLCTSPWSSGTFSQSCRYPQVPDSHQLLSAVSEEVCWSEVTLEEQMEREGVSTRHCRGVMRKMAAVSPVFSAQPTGGSSVPDAGW